MQLKKCNKCLEEKDISFFAINRGICKKCKSVAAKEKYDNDPDFKIKQKENSKRNRKTPTSIYVECDFKISNNCVVNQNIGSYKLKENRLRNNGKYRCKYCAIEDTHLGEKSHFFKFEKNNTFFENIDNEISAYLLGVIAGDGHISKSSNSVSIVANKKDIETLNLFKTNLSNINLAQKKKSNCLIYSITDRKIRNDLCKVLQISPGKKSDKIVLPNINDNLMFHFLRGLLDTDGWINNFYGKTKQPRFYFSSTSNNILIQIKMFFEKYGIKSRIEKIKLVFDSKNASSALDLLYTNENVSLTRKKERYLLWKELYVFGKGKIKNE